MEKRLFKVDWDEVFRIVNDSFDFLENEGIKFDFNDPVIKRLFLNDIERVILLLEKGESVKLLDIIDINNFDDGKEIIKDLKDFKIMLDSEKYRNVLNKMFTSSKRGQPHLDIVLLFKCCVLQEYYDYSDIELVKWIKTPALKWFLDYPEKYPKKSTIWEFRERIIKLNLIPELWKVHYNQIVFLGHYNPQEFHEFAQDAKFITSDQGKISTPRGNQACTRRSRDGTRSKKGDKWYFRYKLHQLMDLKSQLIIVFDLTTASVHDSQIIFDTYNCVVYADKGYVGVEFKGYSGFMLRKSNDSIINAYRNHRNRRISSKRAPVERPFAIIDCINAGKVKVTTVERTKVKMFFACLIYNIKQLITLKDQKNSENSEKEKIKDITIFENFIFPIETIKLYKFINYLKKRRENAQKFRKRLNKKIKRKNNKIKKNEKPLTLKINYKQGYSF